MSALQREIKFLQTASGFAILPTGQGGMLRSLRLLGASVMAPGLIKRLLRAEQHQTMQAVADHVTNPGARRTFQDIPEIHIDTARL